MHRVSPQVVKKPEEHEVVEKEQSNQTKKINQNDNSCQDDSVQRPTNNNCLLG